MTRFMEEEYRIPDPCGGPPGRVTEGYSLSFCSEIGSDYRSFHICHTGTT